MHTQMPCLTLCFYSIQVNVSLEMSEECSMFKEVIIWLTGDVVLDAIFK